VRCRWRRRKPSCRRSNGGAPGRRRALYKPASAIVDDLLDAILGDLKPAPGQPVLLRVNGLGGTPLMALYLLLECAAERLARAGLDLQRTLMGNQATSLEMAGASLTVTLLDDELRGLWDAPVHTPALRW
jgi:dihydroxyacetone kinase-like protein